MLANSIRFNLLDIDSTGPLKVPSITLRSLRQTIRIDLQFPIFKPEAYNYTNASKVGVVEPLFGCL